MNVINLSLGEPRSSRAATSSCRHQRRRTAGVVPVSRRATTSRTSATAGLVGRQRIRRDHRRRGRSSGRIAGFSSAGPTPVSLAMKPDVAAPGSTCSHRFRVAGDYGLLSGTSMATPHVAGAAAILKERHPSWTVQQIKSALEQTGDPVADVTPPPRCSRSERAAGSSTCPRPTRRCCSPIRPASRSTGLLRPRLNARRHPVRCRRWRGRLGRDVRRSFRQRDAPRPGDGHRPGNAAVTATAGTAAGDVTGFVVLTRGADVRRIPFWLDVAAPKSPRRGHS